MGDLEAVLRTRRDGGGRAFVPYVTGGFPGVDAPLLRELESVGADAIEVGIPFSDPVMDGGVIQEASRRALEIGAGPTSILATVAEAAVSVPVVLMTYVNPVFGRGFEAFLEEAVRAGVAGTIVPDLPVDEAGAWCTACERHGVANVLLAAPGTVDDRLATIAATSRGFVYCVATYGVTGARQHLAGTAGELVARLRPLTDLPLLIGVGVGTPEQAVEAATFADGVIVGSALMGRLVEGDREGLFRLAGAFRAALPAA
jgi:tryptophan synthase alpha chain